MVKRKRLTKKEKFHIKKAIDSFREADVILTWVAPFIDSKLDPKVAEKLREAKKHLRKVKLKEIIERA